ncbi:VOC family protein [Billgrantia endophytica]|uniref:VOC family protein n=1 Tax=Billgrantia endophytica TaxID=2033802 RepID=A0A2N7U6Q8_9GAMM|nr:VOC family protein [Halomonas endophytica]PMR76109.1 VOC family protein [Halomonas endophytica]
MSGVLDHLVINTKFDTDAVFDIFQALGFTLSPRGYHSLGSINHVIVFPQSYLELVGLPVGGERLRQEILDSPIGIDGLVMASDDPEKTRNTLLEKGFDVQPVQRFSRLVDLEEGERMASFATVRLAPNSFAAGRVYFCHHVTPELVWRSAWMDHANGVEAIVGLTIVSESPSSTRARYAKLGDFDESFQIDIIDASTFHERFGSLAIYAGDRREHFAAITLRTASPSTLRDRASSQGLPHWMDKDGHRLVIALPQQATLLEILS